MTVRYSLRAAALAGTCLLPLAAVAADADYGVEDNADAKPAINYTNQVETGGLYQSGTSAKFGRYTGQEEKGGYGLGNIVVRGRDAWDSGGTQYYEVLGTDLGLSSRSASVKYGQQGHWGVQLFYDGIPYNTSTTFHTIYDSTGKGTLNGLFNPATTVLSTATATYTAGAVTLNSAGAVTNTVANRFGGIGTLAVLQPTQSNAWANSQYLAPYLRTANVGMQRDAIGGTFNYNFDANWSFVGAFKHEHKEGTQEESMMIGQAFGASVKQGNVLASPAGGNANVAAGGTIYDIVYFPMPINYDTDRYDATLQYSTHKLQAQLIYTFSNFTDNNLSFNATDPFPGLAGTNLNGNLPTAGSGTIQAAWMLPPSNSEHKIKAQVGYNINDNTRVNANVSWALQQQNAAMPSVTNDMGVLTPTQTAAYLANPQFNGKVVNTFGNLGITSRPMKDLSLKASYTVDQRDNQSSRSAYAFNINDAGGAGVAGVTGCSMAGVQPTVATGAGGVACRYNVPFSFTNQYAKLEAGYNVLPQTKLTVGYDFTQRNRNYSASNESRENAFSAKVRSALPEGFSGSLGYTHSVRTEADNYNPSAVYDWLLSSNGVASNSDPYGTVVYFEAPRTRDEIKGMLSAPPMGAINLSLITRFANDHYPGGVGSGATTNGALYSYIQGANGLRNDHTLEIGPDMAFQPSKAVTGHLFYNYEQIFFDSQHTDAAIGNIAACTAASCTPLYSLNAGNSSQFRNQDTNNVHTVGGSLDWQVNEQLKIGTSYNFSYGNTTYNVTDGVSAGWIAANSSTINDQSLLISQLPDVTSQLHTFRLQGEYQFTPAVSLWAGYTFERLIYKDFAFSSAYNTVSFNAGNVLYGGDVNPSYAIHVIGTSLRVKF